MTFLIIFFGNGAFEEDGAQAIARQRLENAAPAAD
jgi:hypothetical protein